jgi:hypothetical protein
MHSLTRPAARRCHPTKALVYDPQRNKCFEVQRSQLPPSAIVRARFAATPLPRQAEAARRRRLADLESGQCLAALNSSPNTCSEAAARNCSNNKWGCGCAY